MGSPWHYWLEACSNVRGCARSVRSFVLQYIQQSIMTLDLQCSSNAKTGHVRAWHCAAYSKALRIANFNATQCLGQVCLQFASMWRSRHAEKGFVPVCKLTCDKQTFLRMHTRRPGRKQACCKFICGRQRFLTKFILGDKAAHSFTCKLTCGRQMLGAGHISIAQGPQLI